MQFTFIQPVRTGHYYIVVQAETEEDAVPVIVDVADSFEDRTGTLQVLSRYAENSLVLKPDMQQQLDTKGFAYRFNPAKTGR